MNIFRSDQLKRDLVWTFGGGKRICVGVNFINNILKVCLPNGLFVLTKVSRLSAYQKNKENQFLNCDTI